jgi:hypothetical protein
MNSPEDDPDLDVEDIFSQQRIALVQARAKLAFHKFELARLAKEYPEVAARLPPFEEYTVADLRTDELNEAVGRINVTMGLGLTGEEEDYWLRLWEYARANLGVGEDAFDGMTREKLAAIIEAGLQTGATSPMSSAEPADADNGAVNKPALAEPTLPIQHRNSWARSRSPHTETLYAIVRQMKALGLPQLEMCERLDAQKRRPPDLVGWRDLTWRAAYLSPKYNGAVKKWLSKATSVTP